MIKNISIRNYKWINNEGLSLINLWTVNYLVGPNGCGKSSILELLYLLGMGSEWSEGHIIKYWWNPTYIFHNNFNANFVMDDGLSASIKYNKVTQKQYTQGWKKNIRSLYLSTIKVNSDENLDFPIKMSLWLDNIENVYKDYIVNFVGETIYSDKNHITHMVRSIESDQSIQFYTKDKNVINIKWLPSWFKSYLWLYIYLVNKINNLKTKDYRPIIICIEEIESTFHPDFQKKIPKLIDRIIKDTSTGGRIQSFISTHSPFVISGIKDKEENVLHKTYMIKWGKTVDLSQTPGREDWFENLSCLSVVSKMLWAWLDDLSIDTKIKEWFNIIYCEGENKLEKDSLLYQTIFPDYNGKRNIFVSCWWANKVENAYYSWEESARITLWTDTSVYAIIDCSCSHDNGLWIWNSYIKTGDWIIKFTYEQREKYIKYHKDRWSKIKMLNRKEIENYIYDPEILSLFIPKIDRNDVFSKNEIEIINWEIKDKINTITELKDINKLELVKLITPETQIYKELEQYIFWE